MFSNVSPAFLGFARGIGMVILLSVLSYLGDASHLTGLVNLSVATVISSLALAWEHSIASKGGGTLFGIVKP